MRQAPKQYFLEVGTAGSVRLEQLRRDAVEAVLFEAAVYIHRWLQPKRTPPHIQLPYVYTLLTQQGFAPGIEISVGILQDVAQTLPLKTQKQLAQIVYEMHEFILKQKQETPLPKKR